jgi:hypothetical protein
MKAGWVRCPVNFMDSAQSNRKSALHNPKLNGAYPELVEGVKFLLSIFRTKKLALLSKFLDSAQSNRKSRIESREKKHLRGREIKSKRRAS